MPIILGYMFQDPQWVPGTANSIKPESASNAEDPGLSLGLEDPLEKEMTIHSSAFAWEILWTEDPGGL